MSPSVSDQVGLRAAYAAKNHKLNPQIPHYLTMYRFLKIFTCLTPPYVPVRVKSCATAEQDLSNLGHNNKIKHLSDKLEEILEMRKKQI